MRLILNVLWFICGGWISGTLWIIAGCVFALTIVGLPWVPAAFRIAGFSYAPFGKTAIPYDMGVGSGLLNILWLIFAGWWLALHHLIIAVVQAVTIIGIPFALQHLKLAGLSLAPVGVEVVETYY
jgi:uncharacterized membrane protein YccF (DUF307 family)